jgi:serine/threonine-protein kinase RsbW
VTRPGMEFKLRVPARPENVALVRQALAGVADGLGVDPAVLADMKTAVTEACNNVVLHAYPDTEGVLEVEVGAHGEGGVVVLVRDYGAGMIPRSVDADEPSRGFGIPLIAALSKSFEIRGGAGQGIGVRMIFSSNGDGTLDEPWARVEAADVRVEVPSHAATGMAIEPGPLMAPVLGRVTALLASRADFPLDRLSEAVLVTDAISAHVSELIPSSHAAVAIEDGDGSLELQVGPLVEGGAQELLTGMELPGLERSLRDLADDVRIEASRGGAESTAGEYLLLRIEGPAA